MDPISLAAVVGQATGTCLSTIKRLHDLRAKLGDAPVAIAAICAESTVISASLGQVQSLLLQRQDLAAVWRSRTELPVVLDHALTGCMVVFSCLDAEMQRITARAGDAALKRWRPRLRIVWNESQLNDLLASIRGQQTAMTVLIQLLQMNTLADIREAVVQKGDAVRASASIARSLRARNPSVKVAESIYSRAARASFVSVSDAASVVVAPSDLEFDFDDTVVNSEAYRRVMAHTQTKTQPAVTQQDSEPGDLDRLTDTLTARGPADTAPMTLQVVQSLAIRQPQGPEAGAEPPSELEAEPLLRCARCKYGLFDLILRVPTTAGGEKVFHTDCFTCTDCDKKLGGYFEFNGVFLCEADHFRRLFLAETDCFLGSGLLCKACGHSVRREYVVAAGKSFHVEHFRCEEPSCARALGGNRDPYYYEYGGRAFCCYHEFTTQQQQQQQEQRPGAPRELPVVKEGVKTRRLCGKELWQSECRALYESWIAARSRAVQRAIHNSAGTPLAQQCELAWLFELVLGFRGAVAARLSDLLAALSYADNFARFIRAVRAMIGCVGALFDAVQRVAQPDEYDVPSTLLAQKMSRLCFIALKAFRARRGGNETCSPTQTTSTAVAPKRPEHIALVKEIARHTRALLVVGTQAATRLRVASLDTAHLDKFLGPLDSWGPPPANATPELDTQPNSSHESHMPCVCAGCKAPVKDGCRWSHTREGPRRPWHVICLLLRGL